MSYRISRRANADIESICDYIAKDSSEAANRLDQRIHTTIKLLAHFPGMGHTRQDVADRRYLFWTVGTYVIAYRIEGKHLLVVRVLHGLRDFRRLFGAKF
ncbi:type II toxin-antitoxin system RelE/ParE family toxin [soil metagenome]